MDMEVLCSSKKADMPKPLRAFALLGGIALLAYALLAFLTVREKAFLYLLTGGAMLFISGFHKRAFLSPRGVVRESRSWTGKNVRLLPWEKISHITLVYRGDQMMAFFERGEETTGVRMLFQRDQEERVRGIFKKYIPGIPLESMDKK
jgi:hypothetical protein